ncbi:MAG: L-threonine 3-dehydrogenase [Planctomycetota bacterium]
MPQKTMKAIIKRNAGPGFEFGRWPVPKPGPGEILVKVKMVGICGTDVHIYDWDAWSQRRIKPPLVGGHEFMGTVAATGPGITAVKIGDRVSAEGHIGCGICACCRTGNGHICDRVDIIGIDVNGCFAEYVVMPQTNIWKMDPRIPDKVAALHDPLGNAVHAVMTAGVSASSVLVMGTGPIGLYACTVARAAGASLVIAVDPNPMRLALAKKVGADVCLDPAKDNIVAEVKKLTHGEGPDVLLEMSGKAPAIRLGLSLVRNGGRVSLMGIPAEEVSLNLPELIIFKGITLFGINGRRMFDTWYQCERFLTQGKLNVDPIVTHEFKLEEFEKGFALIHQGKAAKVILHVAK